MIAIMLTILSSSFCSNKCRCKALSGDIRTSSQQEIQNPDPDSEVFKRKKHEIYMKICKIQYEYTWLTIEFMYHIVKRLEIAKNCKENNNDTKLNQNGKDTKKKFKEICEFFDGLEKKSPEECTNSIYHKTYQDYLNELKEKNKVGLGKYTNLMSMSQTMEYKIDELRAILCGSVIYFLKACDKCKILPGPEFHKKHREILQIIEKHECCRDKK